MALHKSCKLMFFVDLHAHATKRGCFCYANALPTFQEQMDNMLYARLISINSPHYDFNACVFSEKAMKSEDKNGQSKEGSSRVGIYRFRPLPPGSRLALPSSTSATAPVDAIRELPHRGWACRKMEAGESLAAAPRRLRRTLYTSICLALYLCPPTLMSVT